MTEEEVALGRVVDKRRREFTTGRNCARRALATLGLPALPILPGRGRQPVWPSGIIGSITHCDGFCAAAVASQKQLVGLGIDAEPNRPLPPEVPNLVLVEAEQLWVHEMLGSGIFWDTILFSAKESAFKAIFPILHTWIGFENVRISLDPSTRTFCIRLVDRLTANLDEIHRIEGRYFVDNKYIYTSAVIWCGARNSTPARCSTGCAGRTKVADC